MKLWDRIRARLRGDAATDREALQPWEPDAAAHDPAVVVAEGPLPLAEMYADLLRGQGVPAMLRSSGAGRGALGGQPVDVQVLVPRDAQESARAILGSDEAATGDENAHGARKDGESL